MSVCICTHVSGGVCGCASIHVCAVHTIVMFRHTRKEISSSLNEPCPCASMHEKCFTHMTIVHVHMYACACTCLHTHTL